MPESLSTLPEQEVLTADEVRAYLRMKKTAFYDALREGKLPGFKAGRIWRFRRSVLVPWIENQERLHGWRQ